MTSGASSDPAGAAGHRTVARAMAILEVVVASESRGMRLGDLAAAIEAPKSSVHGLAKGLVASGYLREEGGRYLVGTAISSLIAAGPITVQAVYRQALTELASRWNETTMLAILVGESVVYLDSVNAKAVIRATPSFNKRMPLWPRSSGKCLLAFMEPRRLDSYLRRHHRGPGEAESVRVELAKVREDRIGINIGQSVAEHIGIAAPIVPRTAPVTIAIAIAGPKVRMQDRVDEIAASLREVVGSLSA